MFRDARHAIARRASIQAASRGWEAWDALPIYRRSFRCHRPEITRPSQFAKWEVRGMLPMFDSRKRCMSENLSWSKLAETLGTTRRTLHAWRVTFADCPGVRDPEKWLAFMRERGLAHCSLRRNAPLPPAPSDADSSDSEELRELRHRRLKVDTERAEWEFERTRDRHMPVTDFEAALRVTLTAFNASINAFAGRVNPRLEGLDFDSRSEVLEDELNIMRRTLVQCDYLGAAPDPALDAPANSNPPPVADLEKPKVRRGRTAAKARKRHPSNAAKRKAVRRAVSKARARSRR